MQENLCGIGCTPMGFSGSATDAAREIYKLTMGFPEFLAIPSQPCPPHLPPCDLMFSTFSSLLWWYKNLSSAFLLFWFSRACIESQIHWVLSQSFQTTILNLLKEMQLQTKGWVTDQEMQK